MSEQPQSMRLKAYLRTDVVDAWGADTQKILEACQIHMLDALSTELILHQRFHCVECLMPDLMTDFFTWINEEGYCYILEDFQYPEFISHVVRWAKGWAEERALSPCTDGMPSAELH